jgi:hypothetical protein
MYQQLLLFVEVLPPLSPKRKRRIIRNGVRDTNIWTDIAHGHHPDRDRITQIPSKVFLPLKAIVPLQAADLARSLTARARETGRLRHLDPSIDSSLAGRTENDKPGPMHPRVADLVVSCEMHRSHALIFSEPPPWTQIKPSKPRLCP